MTKEKEMKQLNIGLQETELVERMHMWIDRITGRFLEYGFSRMAGKKMIVSFWDKMMPTLDIWVHSKLSLSESTDHAMKEALKHRMQEDVELLAQEWAKELAEIFKELIGKMVDEHYG